MTYTTFSQERGTPTAMYLIVDAAGKTHLEWVGTPALWTVPSGPPSYVFDANGALVDWSPDNGEDVAFERKWGSTNKRTRIPSTADPYPL